MADFSENQGPPAAPDMDQPYLAVCPPAPILRVPPRETLTDGTVTLRRWHASDADALFRIITASRGRLAAWMPWAARKDAYERDEAVGFTARTSKRWDGDEGWDYAITTSADGGEAVIGSCGLRRREDHPGVDAGYWLADGHTGKGYATRAVWMLTEEAFEMLAPSVRIVHDQANEKSRGVPARLGYECQGEVNAEGNPEGRSDTVWVKYPEPQRE
ncbi:Acyl-CoA N-acyltransferase [Akanthomyces lecanii RCEF 1005]|uniref:Acyl-CoA N-acyltransferase n=1 Tax=Akanthomyces lecanii RCEF 1005 TaxID=1081108 RepID=A0A162K602_CORDF|nr:Acyl-CoA N-acyltransferase [Akanthomyces lecanii RCEF 1005]